MLIGVPKVMSTIKFNFIPNDIKGFQSYKTRLTIFEYLKNKIDGNGIVFSQKNRFHEGK